MNEGGRRSDEGIARDFIDTLNHIDLGLFDKSTYVHSNVSAKEQVEKFMEAKMGKQALYDADGSTRSPSLLLKEWKRIQSEQIQADASNRGWRKQELQTVQLLTAERLKASITYDRRSFHFIVSHDGKRSKHARNHTVSA